ncbi:hypothetical protein KI387_016376, partial [Taxus chinensis]
RGEEHMCKYVSLMAMHQLYGNQATADVKLRLKYLDGSAYEGNPIHLHSSLLKEKSEYFKALLSDRWSSSAENLMEMTVNSGKKAESYLKCIQMLYRSKNQRHRLLSNISESLEILSVADEWLLEEASEACLEYL